MRRKLPCFGSFFMPDLLIVFVLSLHRRQLMKKVFQSAYPSLPKSQYTSRNTYRIQLLFWCMLFVSYYHWLKASQLKWGVAGLLTPQCTKLTREGDKPWILLRFPLTYNRILKLGEVDLQQFKSQLNSFTGCSSRGYSSKRYAKNVGLEFLVFHWCHVSLVPWYLSNILIYGGQLYCKLE